MYYIDINLFFWPSGIVFASGRGSFLVLSAPWHARSPPGPLTQVWALAEVRGTWSGGSKWHVRSGRHSEHVEPSRPMQTHVHIYVINRFKKCPASHVLSGILNVTNVVRHWRTWWWKTFSPTPTCPTCDHFIILNYLRPSLPKLINYKTTHKSTLLRPSVAKLNLIN